MRNIMQVRSIEIHDTLTIWNPDKIRKITDFMVRHNMNTLILHENDIADKVVYPSLLFNTGQDDKNIYEIYRRIYEEIYIKTPSPFVFNDEKPIFAELLRHIVKIASEKGIRVFLQVKELWFSDLIYESPVAKNGVVCPSDSFWWESYLPQKYEELYACLPEISGVIISTGTRESRASLAHGKCGCEQCKDFQLVEWQKKIIMSVYKPTKEAKKQLVVRDFTYYADEQEGLREGMADLPADIIVSVKNTPQDFYPTFPNNALIGKTGDRELWVEYEVMGEYFGFGVMPCILIDDIRARIRYALNNRARGFTARVDWEALPSHSVFDTVNVLNVYASALLSQNPDLLAEEIYRAYLEEYGLFKAELNEEDKEGCIESLMDTLGRTWDVMRKTVYMHDFLFSSNSKIPADIRHGDFLSKEHHGLQKWFPQRADDLDITEDNIVFLLQEKDEALTEIEQLYNRISEKNPGLTSEFYGRLVSQFEMYRLYVEMFRATARVYLMVKGATILQDKRQAYEALEELKSVENRIGTYRLPVFSYPGSVLICHDKLHYFRQDAQKQLDQFYSGDEKLN